MPPQSTLNLRVRAMFGLLEPARADARRNPTDQHAALPALTALPALPEWLANAAADLDRTLRPGALALITGPSGAGKSTLARALARHANVAASPATLDLEDRSPVELLHGRLESRLHALAGVGLSDAHVFVRRSADLSVGERARLSIAVAIDQLGRAHTHPTLILDEFASTLDRPGAMRLCRLLRRWLARNPHARVVCITAHDDLAEALAPDLHLHLARGVCSRVPPTPHVATPALAASTSCATAIPRAVAPSGPDAQIDITPGTLADYHALAHHHYRAGPPAVIAGDDAILTARDARTGALAGVLVIAMPTLNAAWRDILWPGRYRTHNKRSDARRLHHEVRCIARVIVAPEHRGLGVAAALVRRYLSRPLTPATEALAAMGASSPFFERAGMRAYRLPPTRRESRLADCLASLELEPADLLRLGRDAEPLATHSPAARALLTRELRRWANASRATRALLDDLGALASRAAAALLAPPIVYAHVSGRSGVRQPSAAPSPNPSQPSSHTCAPHRPPHALPEVSNATILLAA